MAQSVGLKTTKLYNQFGNDLDFSVTTDFGYGLTGNIGDLVKAVYTFDVGHESTGDTVDTWDVSGALDDNVITRTLGSFIDDGFEINDLLDYFIDITAGVTAAGRTVLSVSDTQIVFDGAAVANQTALTTGGVQMSTVLLDFIFDFGLPTTGEGNNFLSKIDQQITRYSVNIDDGFGAQSTSFISGTYESPFPTSQDAGGSFKMKYVSTSNNVQKFEIEHIFRIKPTYLDGSLSDIENGILPSYFTAGNTLNLLTKLRPITNDGSNSEAKAITNLGAGNVGWYDEFFNNGASRFSLDSITFTDKVTAASVAGLQIDRVTQVQVKVSSSYYDLDNNARYGVFINKLPTRDDYRNNTNNFDTNFVFDYGINVRNDAGVDSDFIKSVVVTAGSPAADQIIIDFEVDYSAAQQLLLDTDTSYSIGVGCGHITKSSSNRQAVLAQVSTYVKDNDVTGLLTVVDSEFLGHSDLEGGGFTNVNKPIENKFLSSLDFSIDLSKNAFIKTITERLVSFNTVDDEFFEIEKNEFDVSNVIVSGGSQQIEIDQSKGFKLVDDSKFNRKKITTGALVGTDQNYTIEIAHAFNWMDYLALAGVDTDFYDVSLLNDGLNQKIDRYSGVNNYNIGVFWDFVISNGTTDTTYRVRSTPLTVNDYDDPQNETYSAQTVQVFLADAVTEITGGFDPTETMYIKATFTPTTPVDTSLLYYGIWRLEKYQAGGLNSIWERSSIEDSIDLNPILPLSGETYPKITNNGTTITLEGRIDPTRFVDIAIGDTAHLTADIALIAPNAKMTEDGVIKTTEDGLYKTTE